MEIKYTRTKKFFVDKHIPTLTEKYRALQLPVTSHHPCVKV